MKHRLPALVITLALAACGGGGGGSSPAPATGGSATSAPAVKTQSVQVNMHIPGATTTASTKRNPQFVASSTQGVLVTVYASSDTTHSTPLGSSATNVAPGSTACGGAQGARTCTISIPAPAGTDDFVFVSYDQPPNGPTTFPANANVLAVGTVYNQNIVVASANTVNVSLGGIVASLQLKPAAWSLLAGPEGTNLAGAYTLEVTAFDSDNDAIIAGSSDPYSTPITVTVTETATTPCPFPIVPADCSSGPSGHTSITLGGPTGTGSSSVQVTQSSQIVTVLYDGRGDPSYAAHFTATSSGVPNANAVFNPMFVDTVANGFTPSVPGALTLTPGQQALFNLRGGGGSDFTASTGTCSGIATVTVQPGDGAAARYGYITGGTTPGTCQASFADGFGTTYAINVTVNNNTSANVAVPGDTLAYFSQGSNGIAITTSTAQIATVPTAAAADLLGLDDAGTIYAAVENGSNPDKLVEYTPNTSTYPPTYALSANTFTPTDGAHLWGIQASGAGEFAAFSSDFSQNPPKTTFDEWDPGHTGAPSRSIVLQDPLGSAYFFGLIAHDGSLYMAQYVPCSSNASLTCVQYQVYPAGSTTASRTISETIVPQANQANFTPSYMNVGADGTLYVGEWAYYSLPDPLAGLYIYPPSGPERVAYVGAEAPQGIDTDNVGNIYVVNDNTADVNNVITADTAKNIAVLSPDGQTVLRRITTDVIDANTLSAAADGTVFFSDTPEPTLNLTGASYAVPAGSANPTMLTNISAGNFLLWNGTRQTDARHRTAQSGTVGTAHGGSMHLRRR